MEKGLYIAFEFEYNPDILQDKNALTNGIQKKVFFQFRTFERYGYHMDFYNPYSERKHSIERFLRRCPFHYLNSWNFDFGKISEYEFIYIRKMWFMDGDLIFFLRKVRDINPAIKIILEVPTYPYDSEGKKINMIPLKIKDKKWRKQLYKYVDRIVTYSDHDEIFGIQTIKSVNAIDFESCKRTGNNLDEHNINMIACSSLYYWHGYDRIIEGLYRYYIDNPQIPVNVYIVGNGAEFDNYKKMIDKYNLSSHVFLVGGKYGTELDDIYNKCVIGLDSMGRHRSGVFYNSSLKGKEYCAKGLVIISGVKTELDDDPTVDFYYRIPANDEPVNIQDILAFYFQLMQKRCITDVQNGIMEYAEKNFDFFIAMKSVVDFIKQK